MLLRDDMENESLVQRKTTRFFFLLTIKIYKSKCIAMLGVNLYEDRGEGGSIIKYNFLKVVLIFNNNSIIFDIIFSPK